MNILIAGAASGILMAKFFITIGCITAFLVLRNPPPQLAEAVSRSSPRVFVLVAVFAAYPIWGIIGVVLAFLFLALQNGFPGAGLGSPNLVYTVGVSAASVAIALPLAIPFRRYWPALAGVVLSSIGTLGWLLPNLAV